MMQYSRYVLFIVNSLMYLQLQASVRVINNLLSDTNEEGWQDLQQVRLLCLSIGLVFFLILGGPPQIRKIQRNFWKSSDWTVDQ